MQSIWWIPLILAGLWTKLLKSEEKVNDLSSFSCNIAKRSISEMFSYSFELPDHPVIFAYEQRSFNKTHHQPKELFQLSSYQSLTREYASTKVILSSSNTYSHGRFDSTLGEYLEMIAPQSRATARANESFYLFGHNYDGVWKELSGLYRSPPCRLCDKAGAKTIGIGGQNSGVSFHFHGSGFSEVIHGKKSWYLFPPHLNSRVSRLFDPNRTVWQWFEQFHPFFSNDTYRQELFELKGSLQFATALDEPASIVDSSSRSSLLARAIESLPLSTLLELEEMRSHFYECTIHAGEILYFPSFWMHATLNRDDYNFFVSVFLDLQLMKE